MVGLGFTLTCGARRLLLPQSLLVQHQWLPPLEQSFLHHPWNFWTWNELYDWLIESTMVPGTLVPTNDGAVHNQILDSYLYFLFVLQSCVTLLHKRTSILIHIRAFFDSFLSPISYPGYKKIFNWSWKHLPTPNQITFVLQTTENSERRVV